MAVDAEDATQRRTERRGSAIETNASLDDLLREFDEWSIVRNSTCLEAEQGVIDAYSELNRDHSSRLVDDRGSRWLVQIPESQSSTMQRTIAKRLFGEAEWCIRFTKD
jgi:hypothetical protein